MWFRFWSNVARFDLTSTSQPLSIKPDVDRDSFFRKKRRVEKTIYGYPLLEHIFALFGLTFFGDTQLIRTLSTSIFCIIFGTVTLYLPVLIFWTAQNQFKLTVFPLFFVCVTFLLLLLYNLNKSEILQLNRDIRAFWTKFRGGDRKLIRRYLILTLIYILVKLCWIMATKLNRSKDEPNYYFFYKTLSLFVRPPAVLTSVESFLHEIMNISTTGIFMYYLLVYAFLFQALRHLAQEFRLISTTSCPAERQFIRFWHHRIVWLQLRRRASYTYSFFSFVLIASVFVVTIVYVVTFFFVQTPILLHFLGYLLQCGIPILLITHLAESLTESYRQLNRRVFDFLNNLPILNEIGYSWNETRILSYLNHLRRYDRERVMAWNIFEINRQLPLYIINYIISFVVMAYTFMNPKQSKLYNVNVTNGTSTETT